MMRPTAWKALSILLAILLASFAALGDLNLCERMLIELRPGRI